MAKDNDRQIRVIIEDLEGMAERAVVAITLEVHSTLVDATPVDLGWARANWVPAIGQPGASSSEGQGDAGSAMGKAQSGLAQVAGFKLTDNKVHITNNVPYIEVLNAGSSSQAPADFVQKSIQTGVSRAEKRIKQ